MDDRPLLRRQKDGECAETVDLRGLTKKATVTLPKFQTPGNTPFDNDLLQRLAAFDRPGLTVEQFRELVAECECGLVTTRRVFEFHVCLRKVPVPVLENLYGLQNMY